jgi:hypothetical protein
LREPALARIASVIDEADLVQEVNFEAAAAGLDLVCRGLRRISRDDQQALRRGSLVYDALYAEFSSVAI